MPIKLESQENLTIGKIINYELNIYFEVDFGDGTYSDDMMPQDVIVN